MTQWRDLAIAERDQLRMYDLEIMYSLYRLHQSEVAQASAKENAAARQEQIAALCRKVHGIDDLHA